jgi:ArsR family transcriptional regulator
MENKKYRALKLFKAISNSCRYKLITLLAEKEYEVNELVNILNKPNSTVSNHLKILRDLDIVSFYTKNTTVVYSLRMKRVYEIIKTVEDLFERNE